MTAIDTTTSDAAPATGRAGFAEQADVDLFVERLEAFERGDLSPDDWRAFRLVNGVYGQRQDGVMMIRAKLPGGIATAAQLDALATVAERWGGGGKGHVTTRQNVQFHFVDTAHVEEALRLLADAGITTREACGNSVRNWTACPFAGVAADEPFDVTPYLEALVRHLLRGPYSATLPRKFKPSIGGCCGTDCSQAYINDLGLLARSRDGQPGFRLVAGGGLATLRRSALLVEEFLPAGEVLEAADALIRVFNRIGNRKNKAKARLKWAIDKIGPDAFLAAYHAERDAIRAEGGVPLVLPDQPPAPAPRPPLPQLAPPADGFDAWAADSVRPQKQAGFAAVVVRLILGDASAAQLRAIGRLARLHGDGEVRTTNEQNLVLRWVPTWKVPLVHQALAAVGLAAAGADSLADVTSCPGASSCKLAVTQSRGLASVLTEALEARPDLIAAAHGLDVKISGCPNGCGQHYLAGIGFQGGVRKVGGRAVPQYLVYVGGGLRPDGTDFGRLVGKVPARRAAATLERLLELYVAEGGGAGHAYWAGVPLDRLRTVIADLSVLDEADAVDQDFVDLGETKAFEVVLSEGECAA
jgi:sulfite reductase beta subunit-like hemoprotein